MGERKVDWKSMQWKEALTDNNNIYAYLSGDRLTSFHVVSKTSYLGIKPSDDLRIKAHIQV